MILELPCGCEIDIYYDWVDGQVGGDVEHTCNYQDVRQAFAKLMDYRNHNVLNFQLEKMDDHLRTLAQMLKVPWGTQPDADKAGDSCPHCDGTGVINHGYMRGATCSCRE